MGGQGGGGPLIRVPDWREVAAVLEAGTLLKLLTYAVTLKDIAEARLTCEGERGNKKKRATQQPHGHPQQSINLTY